MISISRHKFRFIAKHFHLNNYCNRNFTITGTVFTSVNFELADAVRDDVKLHLYQHKDDEGVYVDDQNVIELDLDANRSTKFLIHGWQSKMASNFYRSFREQCFENGNYNVVCVDWSHAASKPYEVSSANTKSIGAFIGDFIVASGINLDCIHLIGNSLGGHVAGFTGKHVFHRTGRKVGRITGTDPAGPKFQHEDMGEDARLSKFDAQFVDIVHTNTGYYGFVAPIGTADFYPNGGVLQPGCPAGQEGHDYSHGRAIMYLRESLKTNGFKARKSTSWEDYQNGIYSDDGPIIFGENVPRDVSGVYYFCTNPEPPFAIEC